MDFGFDLVDAKFKDRRAVYQNKDANLQRFDKKKQAEAENKEVNKDKDKEKGDKGEQKEKDTAVQLNEEEIRKPTIDENTIDITDIVFARDPTALDPQTKTCDIEDAFQH